MKEWWTSLWEEQPDERFFSLPLVKVVLWGFGSAFAFTVAIGIKTAVTLQADWSSTGINHLVFDLFKSPIAIIGFGLPILGLIGLNHRSEQTKQQILLSESQNNFTNYYKHIEEFEKYLSNSIGANGWFKDSAHRRQLHHKLFPEASQGNFELCHNFLKKMENQSEQLKEEIESYAVLDPEKANYQTQEGMISNLRRLVGLFNLDEEEITRFNRNGTLNDEYLEAIWNYLSMANSILSFHPKYEENEKLLSTLITLATIKIRSNKKEIDEAIKEAALKNAMEMLNEEPQ